MNACGAGRDEGNPNGLEDNSTEEAETYDGVISIKTERRGVLALALLTWSHRFVRSGQNQASRLSLNTHISARYCPQSRCQSLYLRRPGVRRALVCWCAPRMTRRLSVSAGQLHRREDDNSSQTGGGSMGVEDRVAAISIVVSASELTIRFVTVSCSEVRLTSVRLSIAGPKNDFDIELLVILTGERDKDDKEREGR